jgi:hypothetical protein
MHRIAALALMIILLTGCVAQPAPFQSPMRVQTTFASPLPEPQQRVYIPLAITAAERPKKGISLACGYEDLDRMAREVEKLGVSWIWNWGPTPPLFAGVESVPNIWSAASIGVPLGGNSEWVLGFNEPDQWDQANVAPDIAAQQWAELERTYPDRKLASPQPVRWLDRWLERWYDAYVAQNGRAPRLDALAVHTYWGGTLADYQQQVRYYIGLAEKWGVPEVWVTEFTISPGLERTVRASVDDMRAYIEWLDAQSMVTRYAPWTNRVECTDWPPDSFFDTPMYGANGQLTEIGKMFRDIGTTINDP